MPTAILYTRVSTDEQANYGFSLDAQTDKLKSYCKYNSWEVLKVFRDEGASAKNGFNRPAYKKLKEYLKEINYKVDYILVTQWSRFSRKTKASYDEIDELKNKGIEIRAIEQWDDDTPEGKVMRALNLALPQAEIERLGLRVKTALIQGRKEGRYMAKAPYGYYNDKVTKLICPDPETYPIVQYCFSKFSEGCYSSEEVRRMGKDRGLKLVKQAFLNMLKNPAYIGKVKVPMHDHKPEELIDGLHKAIIENDTFYKVQQLLRGKSKSYKGKTNQDEIPLKGHLLCPNCGRPLTASASPGNGGLYHYYHCQRQAPYNCKVNLSALKLNKIFFDYLKEIQPKSEIVNLYSKILEEVFTNEFGEVEQQKKQIEGLIAEQRNKIEFIDEKWMNEQLPYDEYREMKNRLKEKESDLIMKHSTLKHLPTQYSLYLKYGLSLVGNLYNFYVQASIIIKHRIIGSIFPEKIIFENGSYRTTKLNAFIALLTNKINPLDNKKATNIGGLSISAPETGLEPVTL